MSSSEINRESSTPLYRQIALRLREQIESGDYEPESMLPSVKVLCQDFGGVNHLTVRQAIRELVKEGLLYSVKGKGAFVASQGQLNESTTRGQVGVICSALEDGFAHQIVVGAESYLQSVGYDLMLCNSNYSVSKEAAHLRRFHASRVDGVLLFPYMPPANKDLVESLCADSGHSMPIVCLDRGFPESDIPLVGVDNKRAAHDAVSYLIALGHRRIGFIVNSLAWVDAIEPIRQRLLGYRQALQEHGVVFDKELVQEIGSTLAGMRPTDVGLEHYGYQAMHKLLMLKEPPTAVFLLWDEIAPGALAAIRNSGLEVPKDISLIGFNDDLTSRLLSVPLTTIQQPAERIGWEAAQRVVRSIQGEKSLSCEITLDTKLIIRASTAQRSSVKEPDVRPNPKLLPYQ